MFQILCKEIYNSPSFSIASFNDFLNNYTYFPDYNMNFFNKHLNQIPETLGDSPAAVLDQVKNFMVNQSNTSGGLLAPPGGSNPFFAAQEESSSDDDSDDSDESGDDCKPGLQIGGGANKLKGLFEAISTGTPERKVSATSRKSSSSSFRSQLSTKSCRSQPTPNSGKPTLIIPQVISTDHDEEISRNAVGATSLGKYLFINRNIFIYN